MTYGLLRDRAATVGAASGRWGGRPGPGTPFVGIVSDWTPDFVAAFLGLAGAGWAVGVLDPGWTAPELAGAVTQLDPAVMLVADQCAAAASLLGRDGWRQAGRVEPGWGVLARGDLPPPAAALAPPDASSPFYAGFTSGSSGRPKAFVRSHRSWVLSFDGLSARCPLAAGADVLVPGALSSSHFLFGALHGLHVGASVELIPRTKATPARLAARVFGPEPPAAVYVVPTMLAALARAAPAGATGPGRVLCAGARLEAEVRRLVDERMPATGIVEYYGASELSFVTIRLPGDDTPSGAVGKPFPGVEVSIRDAAGRELPASRTGLVFARSPLVFSGYRGEPPASPAVEHHGGWWSVGDRGWLDDAGYLYVAGRGSSLIITGGANVQPEEVEEVLAGCPGVAACAVVGIPHPVWGEELCAVVVPEPGRHPARAELRAAIAGALATAKRPRRYVLLDVPLPLGRAGKVDRLRVRELVIDGASARELR